MFWPPAFAGVTTQETFYETIRICFLSPLAFLPPTGEKERIAFFSFFESYIAVLSVTSVAKMENGERKGER